MTGEQEEVLRDLLHRRNLIFPVTLYGLLGGDPNDFTTEEYITVAGWLHRLGYKRRLRSRFSHAHLASVWVREELWPGDEPGAGRPYDGIPLKRDPDLRKTKEEREDRRASRRRFHRYLDEL
ncbi:MAG: hypothetical protein MK104_07710 [Erythrobacter sp.]|uniref:hypothetical protein n=1 Tax=Qipengyuania pacifica TaxID=2860199 RepID=UPI0035C79852|nr:hypothetical protein [Erythrobacter sp.]